MVELAPLAWLPLVVLTTNEPAADTDANKVVTGAYVLASPTSKVRLTLEPVATYFCRLPTTWPLVRTTDPVDGIMTLFVPVVMLPLVNVRVPFTVMLDDKEVVPLALLIRRSLKAPVEEIVCAPVPLN